MVDDVAALLRSAATKKRLEGVTALVAALASPAPPSGDALAALLPDVLPCLRDHNAKVAATALAALEAALARVPAAAVQTYFKVLWLNLLERLGDSKAQVREKAVDVVVQLASVLDVSAVFERLLPCIGHKNWRTRESTLRCIWRCLESNSSVFDDLKDEALGHIIKLLEDSAKEVRDAAIETLEEFYTRIGPSLLRELESRNIRSAQMKMLADRFQGAPNALSSRPLYASSALSSSAALPDELPPSLSSLLSSYDLPLSSSSSSMARYLESVRKRELSASLAAKAVAEAEAAAATGVFSPSQSSTASPRSDDRSATDANSSSQSAFGHSGGVSEREIQRDVASIYDQLHLDNDWSKRVDGLKNLQQLAQRCSQMNDSAVLVQLSHAVKSVRERLCEQVGDLRSSVSREACQTIQALARTLRDDFNAHAEFCLGPLMKATYVTIQVISTSADACIRGVIESTRNGYVRFISKLLEGAKSRNQVLRLHCVSYLTLTLQRWSTSHLSKHLELFLSILPAILHDALAEVRAQSRKCFWAFHRVFPTEGDHLLESLDASTQRNVRDDRPRANELDRERAGVNDWSTSVFDTGVRGGAGRLKSSRSLAYEAPTATQSAPSVQRVLQHSSSEVQSGTKSSSGVSGPRRVLGSSSFSASDSNIDANENARFPSRVLSQGALRVGFDARAKASSFSEDAGSERRKQTPVRPLRVLSSSDAALSTKSSVENLFASRPDQSSSVGFHTSAQAAPKPKRIQIADGVLPSQMSSRADQENELKDGPKRVVGITSISPRTGGGGIVSAASRSESSANGTSVTKAAVSAASTSSASGKTKASVGTAATAPVAMTDKLEEAVSSLGSNSWSVRLDAAEYIGGVLQRKCLERQRGGNTSSNDGRLDDRIVQAFVKHLSDAHYRVSHSVLKHFLPLLQLSTQQQLQPQLKVILPKLFQKQIETKESIRVVAKENLEYIAKTFDAPVLTNIALSLLMDGGNMKVKAAICHYLRQLLPDAEAYMRQGNNNSHMRSFLGKMAQLLEEMPVSVTSACGELVQVAARLYGSEMEVALPMLPPTKRTVLSKLLKAKGIVLNLSNSQSGATERFASSISSRGSAPETSDNQAMEPAAPERSSRKRSESPNANSASPQRTIQKRKGADDSAYPPPPSAHLNLPPTTFARQSSPVTPGASSLEAVHGPVKQSVSFDDVLETLTLNNSTERERKVALHKVLALAKAGVTDEVWDKYFGRLLFLLLDASAERDVTVLKVLQGLVELQSRRAHGYMHPILLRLLESLGDTVDVASHITESILSTVVGSSHEPEQVLEMLSPFISSSEPPVLQVVLRLVKVALEVSERVAAAHPRKECFLREEQWLEKILSPVARRLAHSSSDVRKSAVNCVVAFHFATNEDPELMWGFLADQVDATKKKLVQIFVERARLERRSNAEASS